MAESGLLSVYRGRAGGIEGLDGGFRARLEAMYAAMPADIREGFSISSAYRSVAHQRELWNNAVRKYGSEEKARKWVARPGRSNHQSGTAADLSYANDRQRQWFHANAARFGMHFPMDHEPWHIEPLGLRDGTYVPTGGTDPLAVDDEAYTEGTSPLRTDLESQLMRLTDFLRGDAWDHYAAPVSAAKTAQQSLARRRLDDGVNEQVPNG